MSGMSPSFLLSRSVVLLLLGGAGYFVPAPALGPFGTGLVGAAAGALLVYLERRLRRTKLAALIGGGAGLLAASVIAALASIVFAKSMPQAAPFLTLGLWLLLAYLGVALGSLKGANFRRGDADSDTRVKVLDTSVLIDGRVADLIDSGFVEGPFVVPQFVLYELQSIADSTDTLKRNRGRRGLDVLSRIGKVAGIDFRILNQDFPNIREVDLKLVELAREYQGRLVTNDFNLQKVAQVQGIGVLNINELASLLKPAVLPGEIMRVFVSKEGKEPNQGVAYLDDGTMVVVDNARRMISRNIDITVTSVLQTTAGKMIFGKYDERHGSGHQHAKPASGPEPPAPTRGVM